MLLLLIQVFYEIVFIKQASLQGRNTDVLKVSCIYIRKNSIKMLTVMPSIKYFVKNIKIIF